MSDIEYQNPVERLDEFIDKMSRGIMPMVDDTTMKEIELRMHELATMVADDEFDEDEIDELKNDIKILTAKAQDEQRKATRDKVVAIFTLTDEQQKQLREEMSESFVRSDISSYNTSDDDINSDREKQLLQKRASRIRRCYYRQDEWKAAMQTILDIIDYDSKNYPWLTRKEYYNSFWNGTIKLNLMIPMLFLDFHTPIKDPKMLVSIFKGETIIEKETKPDSRNKVRVKDDKAVYYDADVYTSAEVKYMQQLAASGYDTAINHILKDSRKSIYDRFLPVSRSKHDLAGKTVEMLKEHRMFNKYNGLEMVPYKTTDIIAYIHANNEGRLNTSISSTTTKFLNSLTKTETKVEVNFSTNDVLVNENAARKEAAIISTIKSISGGTKY